MAQLQGIPILREIELLTARYLADAIRQIVDWWNDHDSGRRSWSGFSASVTSQSANYTVTLSDYLVLVDSTSAARTLTLPTAVGITGRQFVVKVTSGRNLVTIDGNGSETIDGATTVSLPGSPFSMVVVSDGSNWRII